MKRTILNLGYSRDRIISLDRFLDLIPTFPTSHKDLWQFDTLIGYGVASGKVGEETDSTYRRCHSFFNSNKKGLMDSLRYQAKLVHPYKKDLKSIVSDMVLENVMNYGTAQYLVNVGPRMWMVATPRDFSIHVSTVTEEKALACTAQGRLVISVVSKLTEEEVSNFQLIN